MANEVPEKRGMGRPTKFTPERTERFLAAIKAGHFRNVACDYAGISFQTFRNWIKIAEGPDAPPEYVEFLEALQKAEADAEVFDLALIRRAATGEKDEETGEYLLKPQWQAAAWRLERKSPDRWGRKDATKVELTGVDGGPVDVRVSLGVDQTAIEGLLGVLAVRAQQAELESAQDWLDGEIVD